MVQVVKGVLYLHTHGIIHRDLTLGNLLLTKDMDVVSILLTNLLNYLLLAVNAKVLSHQYSTCILYIDECFNILLSKPLVGSVHVYQACG